MKYLPEFDSQDFIKGVKKKIQLEIEDKDLFTPNQADDGEDFGVMDFIAQFLKGATFGLLDIAGRMVSYDSARAEVMGEINSISANFNPKPYLEAIMGRKDEIISLVKNMFIDEMINPLLEQ